MLKGMEGGGGMPPGGLGGMLNNPQVINEYNN